MDRPGGRARELLAEHDWLTSERVAQAIVDLAGDDGQQLDSLLRAARADWRDVLMWDEDRRNGVVRPKMSQERQRALIARFSRSPAPPPTGIVDLVLTDAGDCGPELLKLVRELTGEGLAQVSALLDDLPVRLVAGTTAEQAEALRSRLAAAGGVAQLR